MDEEMIVWSRIYRRAYGTTPIRRSETAEDAGVADIDPYEEDERESDVWSEQVEDEAESV